MFFGTQCRCTMWRERNHSFPAPMCLPRQRCVISRSSAIAKTCTPSSEKLCMFWGSLLFFNLLAYRIYKCMHSWFSEIRQWNRKVWNVNTVHANVLCSTDVPCTLAIATRAKDGPVYYRSLSMMVLMRWAIVSTVQSANSRRIVFCINSSVSMSTAAVASSRTRILVLRSSVRARQISCFWPTLDRKQRSTTRSDRVINRQISGSRRTTFDFLLQTYCQWCI